MYEFLNFIWALSLVLLAGAQRLGILLFGSIVRT